MSRIELKSATDISTNQAGSLDTREHLTRILRGSSLKTLSTTSSGNWLMWSLPSSATDASRTRDLLRNCNSSKEENQSQSWYNFHFIINEGPTQLISLSFTLSWKEEFEELEWSPLPSPSLPPGFLVSPGFSPLLASTTSRDRLVLSARQWSEVAAAVAAQA